jgi:hypothetical protein
MSPLCAKSLALSCQKHSLSLRNKAKDPRRSFLAQMTLIPNYNERKVRERRTS